MYTPSQLQRVLEKDRSIGFVGLCSGEPLDLRGPE